VPDILDSIIIAENSQGLGDRLVDAAGTHLYRVFHSMKIKQETLHVLSATATI
jgi:hypothetical protein